MRVYPKVVGVVEKFSKKYLGSTTTTVFWKDASASVLKKRWLESLAAYVLAKKQISATKSSLLWNNLDEEQKIECVTQFVNKEVFVDLNYIKNVNNAVHSRQTYKFRCSESPRSCYYTLQKYFVVVNNNGKLVNFYVVTYSQEDEEKDK